MTASPLDKIKSIIWPSSGPSGSPVYIQENGDLLGYVTNLIKDSKGNVNAYLVDSDGIEMRFPEENIIEVEGGYIYQPVWYTESKKILEKLSKQEALNPDLTAILQTKDIPDVRLKKLISESSKETQNVVTEAMETVRLLLEKRDALNEQKNTLRDQIADLAGTRVLGGGNRRDFAITIIDLKRKAQIVDSNLKKLEEVLSKFEISPFIRINSIKKTNTQKNETKEMIDIEPVDEPKASRRTEAGERIKKIRILKLEKNLADKQKQVAETYIKERLRDINKESQELKVMAKENQDNEKVLKFLKNKISRLEKEKKELREKLENVKSATPESISQSADKDDLPVTTDKTMASTERSEIIEAPPKTIGGMDATLISRIGSLIIIGGLVLVLVLSLLGFI